MSHHTSLLNWRDNYGKISQFFLYYLVKVIYNNYFFPSVFLFQIWQILFQFFKFTEWLKSFDRLKVLLLNILGELDDELAFI